MGSEMCIRDRSTAWGALSSTPVGTDVTDVVRLRDLTAPRQIADTASAAPPQRYPRNYKAVFFRRWGRESPEGAGVVAHAALRGPVPVFERAGYPQGCSQAFARQGQLGRGNNELSRNFTPSRLTWPVDKCEVMVETLPENPAFSQAERFSTITPHHPQLSTPLWITFHGTLSTVVDNSVEQQVRDVETMSFLWSGWSVSREWHMV